MTISPSYLFYKISEAVDFHTFIYANSDMYVFIFRTSMKRYILNGQGWALFSIYASSPIDDEIPSTIHWGTILLQ